MRTLAARRRTTAIFALLIAASIGMLLLALMLGERTFTPGEVLRALTGRADDPLTELYVLTWRLPRALAALIVGALLGVSGAMFQTLTRNPLGSPDIIGFTTGAHTGGLIVLILVGSSYAAVAGGAVAGGLATALAVMLLARRGRTSGFRLIIVGIALTSMLASLDTYLVLTADLDIAMVASVWGAGSFNGVAWEYAAPSLAVGLVLLALAALLARPLAQLDLGDDLAEAIGARPERTRVLTILLGVALVAVTVTVAGPIAFLALAAPQIARRLIRAEGTPMLPAALVGAPLLLAADLVAQHAFGATSLPVGVVTVSLGGIYLLILVARERRKGTL
ncbi:MAG: iron chelate uptake ABC transporter family permease subunit [Dermabacter sp.]|nr:iron chelate uptake ABC transporter family permease subunit [Dermabacter sp.]